MIKSRLTGLGFQAARLLALEDYRVRQSLRGTDLTNPPRTGDYRMAINVYHPKLAVCGDGFLHGIDTETGFQRV